MGLQINLVKMLGLPSTEQCPKCKRMVPTEFEDYDLETGPDRGNWKLHLGCDHCEEGWTQEYKFTVEKIS